MKKKQLLIIPRDHLEVTKRLANLIKELQASGPFICALTYREKIKLFGDEEINLAILDIGVPDKSEVDLIQLIKKHEIPATLIVDISDSRSDEFSAELNFKLSQAAKMSESKTEKNTEDSGTEN